MKPKQIAIKGKELRGAINQNNPKAVNANYEFNCFCFGNFTALADAYLELQELRKMEHDSYLKETSGVF